MEEGEEGLEEIELWAPEAGAAEEEAKRRVGLAYPSRLYLTSLFCFSFMFIYEDEG